MWLGIWGIGEVGCDWFGSWGWNIECECSDQVWLGWGWGMGERGEYSPVQPKAMLIGEGRCLLGGSEGCKPGRPIGALFVMINLSKPSQYGDFATTLKSFKICCSSVGHFNLTSKSKKL